MKIKLWVFVTLLALTFSLAPPPAASAAKTPKLVYEAYYTVTILPNTPYGWYSDRVEEIDGKIAFKNRFVKTDSGITREEILTSLSTQDARLQPIFFNFQTIRGVDSTEIDGTIKNQTQLTAKIRVNQNVRPDVQRSVPKGTFWSSVFTLWLKKNGPQLKPGESKVFNAILEDNTAGSFDPVPGRVSLESPDEFAKTQKATRYKVNYGGSNTYWYLDPAGVPVRIDFPDANRRVEKAPKEVAENFLK